MKLDNTFKKMQSRPKKGGWGNRAAAEFITKNCLFCQKEFISYSKENKKLCSNECRLKNKSHLTLKRFNWMNDKKPRHIDRLLKLN